MQEGATFEPLTKKHFNYIWKHMRDYDKVEMNIVGGTSNAKAWKIYKACDENIVGLVDNVPICLFGHTHTINTIRFNFISTDEVNKYWKQITKSARSYINWIMSQNPKKRGVIEVWEEHEPSRKWLKILGFRETNTFRNTIYGKTIFVEFHKYT